MAPLTEEPTLAETRAELPSLAESTYLNTGTYGPLSVAAEAATREGLGAELHAGRTPILQDSAHLQEMEELKRLLASMLAADGADEIALTHHTTEGINCAIWGIDWQAGDEIVTTTQEHEGVLAPVYQLQRRTGTRARHAEVGSGSREEIVDGLTKAIGPRTRAVVLSHVSYVTGTILPIAEIAEIAHRHGALVVVDGAQAVGAVPVDVGQLGADVYAFPGQKWLCGPSGTGAFYIGREAQQRLEPTFTGFYGVEPGSCAPDRPSFSFAGGAAGFEVATTFRPGLHGFAAGLRWLVEEVGLDRALAGTRERAAYCRSRLSTLTGCELVGAEEEPSGLVSVELAGVEAAAAAAALGARGIVVRNIPHHDLLRLSCGFFNLESEIDEAADALQEVIEGGESR